MRIISKWQEGDEAHSIAEVAQTLGFNAWKIAYKSIKSMQDERLYFTSNTQGLLVVAEFMVFQIQIADRLAFDRMDPQERGHFVQVLAKKCLEILSDNRAELQAQDPAAVDYKEDFLVVLNERLSDYADFSFDDVSGPSYHFYRYLGEKIGLIMGDDQDNKWAIDQVMEIEGPQVYLELRKSMDMLYG